MGIEVHPTSMGIMLQQDKYILDILHIAGMSSYKLVDILISTLKLAIVSDYMFSNPTCFREIVGALQYLTFTRLDIYFTVNKVCQFMHASADAYWVAVKRILCYLNGTISFGLHITCSSSFSLHGFTNVDWASSVNGRKSISGYLVYFDCTLIAWKSVKQRIVS